MLNQQAYIQTIQSVYPELTIHHVQVNQTGQHNDVFIINNNLVFRFPRYTHVIPELAAETHLLEQIQGKVSLPVPNPIYHRLTGKVGEVFVGYRMISGEPLWRSTVREMTDETVLQKLATSLAQFLYGLHNLRLDLPCLDTHAEYQNIYDRIREKLFKFMRPDARQQVNNHFEPYLNDPANFDFQPVLRHGDFGTVNVLYDAEQQEIAGIIDFGSTGMGDPAVDLAGLLSGYGEDFLRRMAEVYAGLDNLWSRIHFYRGTYALQEALFGIENDDKDAFESGMVAYV